MAGLALALELLSKASSSLQPKSLHSFASLSAVSAATAAASTEGFFPWYTTVPSQIISGDFLGYVAHCKEYKDSERWELPSPAAGISTKQLPDKSYDINLKPFFSAFGPKALATTILRALLLNFQPVLEAYVLLLKPEEDDDDEEEEEEEEASLKQPVDYKAALKGSGRTILREVTIVTMRRLLERVVVQWASKRMSWKLLKDLPKSSERKAGRHMPKLQLFVGVTKTTFRGHVIAISASWLVQLALDIYNCIHNLYRKRKKLKSVNGSSRQGGIGAIEREELGILWRRIVGNTLKCGASLIFASIGAGLGAVLIRPSSGQWIGCAVGELVGGVLMGFWIDSWIIFGTFNPPEVD